jgi:hypothetical protein
MISPRDLGRRDRVSAINVVSDFDDLPALRARLQAEGFLGIRLNRAQTAGQVIPVVCHHDDLAVGIPTNLPA